MKSLKNPTLEQVLQKDRENFDLVKGEKLDNYTAARRTQLQDYPNAVLRDLLAVSGNLLSDAKFKNTRKESMIDMLLQYEMNQVQKQELKGKTKAYPYKVKGVTKVSKKSKVLDLLKENKLSLKEIAEQVGTTYGSVASIKSRSEFSKKHDSAKS